MLANRLGGGGPTNTANRVTDSWSTVGGGRDNQAGNANAEHDDARNATVAGGSINTASGEASTVGGGVQNVASGINSIVSGGQENTASGVYSSISGGRLNSATGFGATVAGGFGNAAAGGLSFAAGFHADAQANGCFVWSDESSSSATSCTTANHFLARAIGGFALRTNTALTTGCSIAAGGGSWNCSSSRELKDDFAPINAREILERVATLPIHTWRYRDERSGARHLGPTAEDFRAAFGLGHSDKEIGLIDGQGVALAAIQALHAKLAEQAEELRALKAALAELLAERSNR